MTDDRLHGCAAGKQVPKAVWFLDYSASLIANIISTALIQYMAVEEVPPSFLLYNLLSNSILSWDISHG